MASQSGIAEADVIVSSDQISYQQKMFSHPDYRYQIQQPNTFGQPIYITSARSPVTINLPPEPYNLAQSTLNFQVLIPASTNGLYTWTYRDKLCEIGQIQLYGASPQYVADIDNLQNYLDIVEKKETSIDEFMTLDPLNVLYPSNSLNNVVPALRIGSAVTPNPSNKHYVEPAYFNVGSIANAATDAQCQLAANGAVIYNVQYPLRLIKNSLFSIDKTIYWGQVMYLRLYFGTLSKLCYTSTSNAQPSAGTLAQWTPSASATSAASQNVSILNLQLMLAMEKNPAMVEQMKSGFMAGKSMIIPWVQAFKNNNNGATQTISIQFTSGFGRTLMKVIHAPYNNTEFNDTAYDHANNDTGPIAQKVIQYYTQLNGARLQDLTLNCASANGAGYTDYLQNRRHLRKSVLQNLNIYQYNWFHCDDFCDFGPTYDQHNSGELISGVPLGALPLTWTFLGQQMTNANYQHYTYAVFSKKLSIGPGMITVE